MVTKSGWAGTRPFACIFTAWKTKKPSERPSARAASCVLRSRFLREPIRASVVWRWRLYFHHSWDGVSPPKVKCEKNQLSDMPRLDYFRARHIRNLRQEDC